MTLLGNTPVLMFGTPQSRGEERAIISPLESSVAPDDLAHRQQTAIHVVFLARALDDVAREPVTTIALRAPGVAPIEPARKILDALADFPGSVDILKPLPTPRGSGKLYHPAPIEPSQVAPPVRRESPGRCKHGMLIGQCSTCKEQEARKKAPVPPRVTAVDLLEFVRPYLEPPIREDWAESLLEFPPGKAPYPYQWDGIEFLKQHERALLADEMGLGKTIQVITALRALYRLGRARRALVLCPRSMLGTWQRETASWAPELTVQLVRGSAEKRALFWRSNAHVLLTTYETVREDAGAAGSMRLRRECDCLILDEVALKAKNRGTGIHRALRKLDCRVRWAMTGTPLENKVDDVKAIFDLLDPSVFARFASDDPVRISERIRKLTKRRRKSDVLPDLPEIVEVERWLDLTDEQRRAYDEAEEAGVRELGAMAGATRINVLALITKLKQICNRDEETGKSCKLEYLADQLPGVFENDEKALVYSQFPNETLRKLDLMGFDAEQFDGSLSDRQREDLLDRFSRQEKPRLLLVSIRSGGVGLNLVRANWVFHFDHWWNPAATVQATARVHRPGQYRTVFIQHLYASDTIEERIYSILASKQHLFDQVIDSLSTDQVVGQLTDAELFGLFGLEPPKKPVASQQAP